MKVYNHKDAFVKLYQLFREDVEESFIAVFDETAIHYGHQKGFNEDVVKKYNIPTYDIMRGGSAFVTSPGDVVYCVLLKKPQPELNNNLREFIKNKLEERGIYSVEADNDLLIEKHKCAGFMKLSINGKYFYGGHISINCNLPLIKEICTKQMKKEPCGLSKYNVSTQDVIDWIQEFLKK